MRNETRNDFIWAELSLDAYFIQLLNYMKSQSGANCYGFYTEPLGDSLLIGLLLDSLLVLKIKIQRIRFIISRLKTRSYAKLVTFYTKGNQLEKDNKSSSPCPVLLRTFVSSAFVAMQNNDVKL